ncbi:MAG: virulence RhuM family protein, partial [Victivallales bacterium]|nr:virulence RhuM family protein [Victivallales bacterium]
MNGELQINKSQILMFESEDGSFHLEVRLEDETVWLTQGMMAELFGVVPQNITLHIKNIYDEGELQEETTCKDFLQVRREGSRQVQRSMKFYNLDVIISVGYRVNSRRATQFRQWATSVLKEYIRKGYVLND